MRFLEPSSATQPALKALWLCVPGLLRVCPFGGSLFDWRYFRRTVLRLSSPTICSKRMTDSPHLTSPLRRTWATNCVRLWQPSLRKILWTCVLIVPSVTTNLLAICP